MAVTAQPRRRLPPEVRREQLLDAALRLLSSRGYPALSVEAVAREAGVSKTVVYDMYGGLEPMLAALLAREERGALQSLADATPQLAPDADPAAAFTAWASSLAHAVADNAVTWRLMLIPPDGTPPMVRAQVQRGRDIALEQVRVLTAALFAAQPATADIEIELAARSLLAAAEEGARLLVDESDAFTPERLTAFIGACVRALRGPSAAA